MTYRTDQDADPAIFPDAVCIAATDLAILVLWRLTGRTVPHSQWIPKSVVHDDSEVFDAHDNARGKLVVKQWWALNEGLW